MFRMSYLVFSLLLTANISSSFGSDPDLSLVKQHFNFFETYDMKDKDVFIFGCGHGDHNERGIPGDHGDHKHDNVFCFDISEESKADKVINVAEEILPDFLTKMADVVYFEYLTPQVIYSPVTMANAMKCLKPDGLLVWDVYWGLGFTGSPEHMLANAQSKLTDLEIPFLNGEAKFQSVFSLSKDKEELRKQFYCGKNPFNGRENSMMFIVQRKDLDETKLNAFLNFFKPGVIPTKLLELKKLFEVKSYEELDQPSIKEVLELLSHCDNWHPEAKNYEKFHFRMSHLRKKICFPITKSYDFRVASSYLERAFLDFYNIRL